MAITKVVGVITETSPATASTAAGTSTVDISDLDWFECLCTVQGGTGGTLDVYIQARAGDEWWDYAHLPQLSAGASAEYQRVSCSTVLNLNEVGVGTSPALAASTCTGGKPGDALRLCFTAGAGTSAGASQTMKVVGFKS